MREYPTSREKYSPHAEKLEKSEIRFDFSVFFEVTSIAYIFIPTLFA
jgi:hypothetical protein